MAMSIMKCAKTVGTRLSEMMDGQTESKGQKIIQGNTIVSIMHLL